MAGLSAAAAPAAAALLRPLQQWPLSAVLALQAQAYGPQLIERAEVLAAKIAAAAEPQALSWGAASAQAPGDLLGYAIACPWQRAQAPQWNQCAAAWPSPAQADCLYVHDIAIHPQARGQGLAAQLLRQCLAQGRRRGWRQAALVAVQGAQGYWQAQGFAPASGPDVSSFGPGAVWMTCAL